MSMTKRYFTSPALKGFVDVFDVEHFDVASNPVLSAEIEHFLGFGNATNQ